MYLCGKSHTMRVLRIFVVVLVFMLIGFLLWNLTLSSDYRASASVTTGLDAGTVMDEVSDLKNWPEWTTFLQRDTTMVIDFSDPANGERAWLSWASPDGTTGRLEITGVREREIELLITFQGFSAASGKIQVTERDRGSQIQWDLHGTLPFYTRFMKTRFEEMISRDFEKTLRLLDVEVTSG